MAATVIDEFVASGRNEAVVSAMTVTEALVRPMRAGSASAIEGAGVGIALCRLDEQ